MFTSDRQICSAVRVLLSSVHLEQLWTDAGPTDRACDLLRQNGGVLSSGERVMLLAAFAFWNGDRTLSFSDVFSLDGERIDLLGGLLAATANGTSVQLWITGNGG